MVTRLKAKDLPQPWHSSKKTKVNKQGQNCSLLEVSIGKDSYEKNAKGEQKRRGRPSTKSIPHVIASPKGMKKTRPLPVSAVDVLRSVSQTCVPSVEELRRKRQEDAQASGRTVRTISPRRSRRSTPMVVMPNSANEDADVNVGELGAIDACPSHLESSSIVPPAEGNSGQKEKAVTVIEEARQESEPVFSQRPGKEPAVEDVEEAIAPLERKQKSRHRPRDYIDIESTHNSQERIEGGLGGRQVRVRSLSTKYSREPYEDRRSQSMNATGEGHHSHQQRRHESFSRSPRRERSRLRERSPRLERNPRTERTPERERYTNSYVQECRSPRRNDSGSPGRWRESRRDSSGLHFEEYEKCALPPGLRKEHWNSRNCNSQDRRHRRRSVSSSPERYRRHWRSDSGEHARAGRQQNSSTYLSVSPCRKSVDFRDAVGKELMHFRYVKAKDAVETSAATDRRRRRHEQAVLDAMTARRKREGNKPFYLTLNAEGKPYGPGKPAWIAEINKLANWLDPSCLHIRKQTFEDIQTFRERLDDNFEYGGALNEDHLRSLMGKAVTKKRAELINLIKNGGDKVKQPVHIDQKVWRRLEKMATSKEREERSEQGRYANSCRRVIGRTGRRGIDGVWEKLHSLLGRSPDPSEIEEEMQRDKGYGGRKRKSNAYAVQEEKSSAEVMLLDKDSHSGGSRRNSNPQESDGGYDKTVDRHVGTIGERTGRNCWSVDEDFDGEARMNDGGYGSSSDMEAIEMTKDDYIEKLEAEIKQLHEEKANASTSKVDGSGRNRMK